MPILAAVGIFLRSTKILLC